MGVKERRPQRSRVYYLDGHVAWKPVPLPRAFAREGVNLSHILFHVGGEWRYVFHVEAEGSRLDERLKHVIAAARRRAIMLNVLGSYRLVRLDYASL